MQLDDVQGSIKPNHLRSSEKLLYSDLQCLSLRTRVQVVDDCSAWQFGSNLAVSQPFIASSSHRLRAVLDVYLVHLKPTVHILVTTRFQSYRYVLALFVVSLGKSREKSRELKYREREKTTILWKFECPAWTLPVCHFSVLSIVQIVTYDIFHDWLEYELGLGLPFQI